MTIVSDLTPIDVLRPGVRRLDGISSRAWEHPADRAALAALRKVPGFELIIRKVMGFVGDRTLRFLYLGSAVRVSDRQMVRVHRAHRRALDTLDAPWEPELFVAQQPFINARAVGIDRPVVVLNTATVALMNDDELAVVIGHELGHIFSDHVLYKTMMHLLVTAVLGRIGAPLGAITLFSLVAALREWDRKSELSADRAGLLAAQDPLVAYRTLMKLAGGSTIDDMSIDEFVRQAEEYERGGGVLDSLVKLTNLMGQRHPFAVMRLAELKRWVDSGAYGAVVGGGYALRADDERASVYDALKDGAKSYRESYASSIDPIARFVSDLGSNASSAWQKAREFVQGRGKSGDGHAG